ncbi:AAA family ATPase [Nocardioides sp. AX2bis]|uniref:AAA family ATPase n=2 Tax=Nocardioides TaxID=1839 RepID=UPI0012F26D76|nr:SMC family ATPase [Nocardioides sp. AX2bis]VXB61087.1 Exonuclease SbcC [Nocardioides sp. AX2bis]
MRLHELEVAAFGPFTDAVTVDLDALAEGGLFLLSGPTGAGKTSVLDAVCFALYGEVPGDRAAARRLRSDQAAEGAEPRVRLVATLAGRRFELTRTPAWQRPKKRGTGTTQQQASVRVRERVDGSWTTLTTRLDEAGHLATTLLGMNLAQFTQVAMLPQGRFQAFLRADSDERQKLLQRLFGTARFERAESWLRERRSEARREHDRAHLDLSGTLGRVAEVGGADLPAWDLDDLALPARSGEVTAWTHELARAADDDRATLDAGLADVATQEQEARALLEAARVEAERLARRSAATAELEVLRARTDDHDEEVRRLEAARRAAPVAPLRTRLTAALGQQDRAGKDHAVAWAEAEALLGPAPVLEVPEPEDDADEPTLFDLPDDRGSKSEPRGSRSERSERHETPTTQDAPRWSRSERSERHETPTTQDAADLTWMHEQADAALADATAVDGARSLEHRAREVAAGLAEVRTEVARRTAQVADLVEACAGAPTEIATLRSRAAGAQQAVVRAEAERRTVRDLEARSTAARDADRVLTLLAPARQRHAEARDEVLAAREVLLDLRERRIAGMAAELAVGLAVGASCPVCGSAEHPTKADPAPGSPDATAERRAQHDVDQANTVAHLRDEEVRDLESRLAAARARAGDDETDELLARTEVARAACAALEAEAAGLEQHHRDLDRVEQEQEARQAALTEARSALDRAEERRTALEEQCVALDAELAAVRGGHPDLDTAERHHLDRVGAARRAVRAAEALVSARTHVLEATAALAAAAEHAGFASPEQARDATLPGADVDALDARVRRHRERLSAVTAVLRDTDPGPATGGDQAQPDLPALEATHRAALDRLGDHRGRQRQVAHRAARLGELDAEVTAAVARWTPLRDELDLVARLSTFAEGRSADNRWQIRFSAYVLAYRLSQVVAAANVRLARMSDQRYALEHTADRGRDRRGGLGLLVRDDWSGLSRNPSTLSGGETFVVSLALALGLSDVITAEAGGVELDTLFVDEGFGSLDADTLDDVMDTLDALRDGGRVVGVVSHVAEMRDRIPVQLRVTKARTGSRLAIHR